MPADHSLPDDFVPSHKVYNGEARSKVSADGRPKGRVFLKDLWHHVPEYALVFSELLAARALDPDAAPDALMLRVGSDGRTITQRFKKSVGWNSHSPDPWVRTREAYDVGYAGLCAVLGVRYGGFTYDD
jgi:hypothetical protein